jgi:class 3 adenylate cyclase
MIIDDGVRATICALEIYEALQAVHAEASIGMATGMVYCGEAGSSQRCEYTAVGFKVIMAARLMQVCMHAPCACVVIVLTIIHLSCRTSLCIGGE